MDDPEKEQDALEHILFDESAEPIPLSYTLLSKITNDFSHVIGSGGFGVVYLGFLRNGNVAVKKLSKTDDFSEKQFEDELKCLIRVKHKNIVRFLGYCSVTQRIVVQYNGQFVLADDRRRFLCFAYVPNKSLHQYLKDESHELECDARYQLIEGICQGLCYLHNEERINHLDLKPQNILLDANMVPKITDFGLSRRFGEEQSRLITKNICATPGYAAPEYWNEGEISFKSDIYSLGIIIRNILTRSLKSDFENWHELPDMDCPRLKRCIKIAQLCVDNDQSRRPSIDHIINMLNGEDMEIEMVSPVFDSSGKDEGSSLEPRALGSSEASKLLDVYPLDLRFSVSPYKRIGCPITLTNRTDHHVGTWITPTSPDTDSNIRVPVLWEHKPQEDPCSTLFQMVEPHSTIIVTMTLKKQQQPPKVRHARNFEVLMINMEYLRKLNMNSKLLERDEKLGGEMYRAMLRAVICNPACCQVPVIHKFMPEKLYKLDDVACIDVHPTETWILVGHRRGNASIWNYQTKERVMVLRDRYRYVHARDASWVWCAKFFAGKQWFAMGDYDGWVHVYAYTTREKVKEFEAYCGNSVVSSLAVHPTKPFLLTSSFTDTSIKLWDWGQDWMCTRTFTLDVPNMGVFRLIWSPGDSNSFASVSRGGILKHWEIHSSSPITTLERSYNAGYVYTDSHQQLMVTASDRETNDGASIWDLQTKEVVHKLCVTGHIIGDVACHPTLPLFITTSFHYGGWGPVCLWDARTYRLEKMVHLADSPVQGVVFTGTKDLTRLAVRSVEGISVMEIDLPTVRK